VIFIHKWKQPRASSFLNRAPSASKISSRSKIVWNRWQLWQASLSSPSLLTNLSKTRAYKKSWNMYLRRLKKYAEILIDKESKKYRIIINNQLILINSLFARELTLASNQEMTKMATFLWTILSRRIHQYSLKSATALLRCFKTSVAAIPSLMIMIWWIKMIMIML